MRSLEALLPGELHIYEEVSSTNDVAADAGMQGAPHGSLYVAKKQTAGRGRGQRVWDSTESEDIYMSLLLKPALPMDRIPMLTLVTALAVAETAGRYAEGSLVQIKWPNDVLLGTRKLCGILSEMRMDAEGRANVVLGLGINLNRQTFPEELSRIGTSICLETGKSVDRYAFICDFIEVFWDKYETFVQMTDLTPFLAAYEGLLVSKGREVILEQAGERIPVICEGINARGELVYTKEDVRGSVASGEVSVRGIYV